MFHVQLQICVQIAIWTGFVIHHSEGFWFFNKEENIPLIDCISMPKALAMDLNQNQSCSSKYYSCKDVKGSKPKTVYCDTDLVFAWPDGVCALSYWVDCSFCQTDKVWLAKVESTTGRKMYKKCFLGSYSQFICPAEMSHQKCLAFGATNQAGYSSTSLHENANPVELLVPVKECRGDNDILVHEDCMHYTLCNSKGNAENPTYRCKTGFLFEKDLKVCLPKQFIKCNRKNVSQS